MLYNYINNMSTNIFLDNAEAIVEKYTGEPPKGGNYRLNRMKRLMFYLGNPQDSYQTIHVAGTSGKTSTSYYVAALLKKSGYKVGLTVSPHIEKISERAQINLKTLGDSTYYKELEGFNNLVELSAIKPSRFEFLTAFAFYIFKKYQVEFAVVEVGLGGLLDATNVINRSDKICLITDIGIDHTKLLGNTIGSIAQQKAGIIQNNNQVFMYKQSNTVMKQIKNRCQKTNAILNVIDQDYIDAPEYAELPDFQKRNLNLAIKSIQSRITPQSVEFARNILIPGRREVIGNIILDGSHNVQKITKLVESLQNEQQKIVLLVSFGNSEKLRIQQKFNLLRRVGDEIIITKFTKGQDETRLSINPTKLAQYAKRSDFRKITTEVNSSKALELLRHKIGNDKIGLITGSFYLISKIRKEILL